MDKNKIFNFLSALASTLVVVGLMAILVFLYSSLLGIEYKGELYYVGFLCFIISVFKDLYKRRERF